MPHGGGDPNRSERRPSARSCFGRWAHSVSARGRGVPAFRPVARSGSTARDVHHSPGRPSGAGINWPTLVAHLGAIKLAHNASSRKTPDRAAQARPAPVGVRAGGSACDRDLLIAGVTGWTPNAHIRPLRLV